MQCEMWIEYDPRTCKEIGCEPCPACAPMDERTLETIRVRLNWIYDYCAKMTEYCPSPGRNWRQLQELHFEGTGLYWEPVNAICIEVLLWLDESEIPCQS